MKKLISVIIAISVFLSTLMVAITASAASNATITIDNANGNRGDTIKVSVKISRNSGIQALGFDFKYDQSVFELVSATRGAVTSSAQTVINTSSLGKVVFSLVSAGSALSNAGSLLDIELKIKPNAAYGNTSLSINLKEASDGDFNEVGVSVAGGIVTVNAPQLDTPENLYAVQAYSNAVTVAWDYVPEASGYNIYLNGKKFNEEVIVDPSYTVFGLEPKTTYQVQISSINYTTESVLSESIEVTTLPIQYTVTFLTENHELIESFIVNSGDSIVPPLAPEKEGYIFDAWRIFSYDSSRGTVVDDFSSITEHMTLRASYIKSVLTVAFIDWDGTVLSEQTVNYGESAVAPEIPSREGHFFTTWSKNFNNVTEDITVQAQYVEITCEHINTEVQGKVESTCETAGFAGNIVCTDCGETISIGGELELAEHDYKSVVTNPTPYSQGFTTHTCIVCGDNYIDSYVDYVDENAPQIAVDSKKSMSGKTIDVTISLKNNPGIVSATMRVTYDSNVLTLIRVTDAGVLGSTSHKPELINPYTLVWVNDTATSNFTSNGKIVTLTFEVSENVPLGKYSITVAYDYDNYDIYNANAEKVKFVTVNGYIEIIDVMIGDVNSDGLVNNLDRMVLTRYLADWEDYGEDSINSIAADVNSDGLVNNLDRMVLTRHLADWEGYESLPYAN